MSVSEDSFVPEPLPQTTSKTEEKGRPSRLPFTRILTAILGMGFPYEVAIDMSYTEWVLILQAQEDGEERKKDGPRQATQQDIQGFM